MPTDVIKSSDHGLLICDDNQTFPGDIVNQIVTWSRDFTLTSDQYPLAGKDSLSLLLENFRRNKIFLSQGLRARGESVRGFPKQCRSWSASIHALACRSSLWAT